MSHSNFHTTPIRLYSANSLKYSILTLRGGGRSRLLSFRKSTSSPSHRTYVLRGGFFVSALMAVMLVFVLSGCTKEPLRPFDSAQGQQAQAPSNPSDPKVVEPVETPTLNDTSSIGFTIDTTWLPDTIIPLNP